MNIKLALTFFLVGNLLHTGVAQAHWYGNWLVGASGSYGERLGDVDIQLVYRTALIPEPFRPSHITEKYVDRGTIWGIFAGYQVRCNRYLIGLEANLDWDDMNNNAHDFAFLDASSQVGLPGNAYIATAQYYRDSTFGVSFRFGYEVTPCFMPFIRFGGETSKDRLTLFFEGRPLLNPNSAIIEDSERIYRFFGGVGAEMPLSFSFWQPPFLRFLSLRMEYCVHASSENPVEAVGSLNSPNLLPLFVNKMKPVTHTGKLSLVWNFI